MILVLLDCIPLYQLVSKQLLDPLTHLKHLEHCHLTLKLTHEDYIYEYSWFWRAYQKKIPQNTLLLSQS